MVDESTEATEQELTGEGDLLKAKEEFCHFIAGQVREAIKKPLIDYDQLYRLSELININITPTAKVGRPKTADKKAETPIQKTKRKAAGNQVIV